MNTLREDQPPQRRKPFLKICKSAAQAIRQFHMIEEGDRLLLGVSGGEDSLMLMHVLTRLQQRAPVHFDLIPVLVNMKFTGFRCDLLQEYCRKYQWDLRIITLDGEEILRSHDAGGKPCPLCSRLRRGKLHGLADELGCNKIVLGHHLDDLCVSFLLSLFRGGGLKTMGPNVAADSGSKRLIRPFCTTTKEEIHAASQFFSLPSIKSCPFEQQLQDHGDRYYLEELLKTLNLQFPFVRSSMLKSLGDIRTGHLLDPRFLTASEDPDAGKL